MYVGWACAPPKAVYSTQTESKLLEQYVSEDSHAIYTF